MDHMIHPKSGVCQGCPPPSPILFAMHISIVICKIPGFFIAVFPQLTGCASLLVQVFKLESNPGIDPTTFRLRDLS